MKKIPQLKDLELVFGPTKWMLSNRKRYATRIREQEWHPWDNVPCQKLLVDFVLASAWDHIRHVPAIKLSGYIKLSTKIKWKAAFEAYHSSGTEPAALLHFAPDMFVTSDR